MNVNDLPQPDEALVSRITDAAFARLGGADAGRVNLAVIPRIYPTGHVLNLVTTRIEVPADAVLVFEDLMPGANYGHPVRYRFHSADSGEELAVYDAEFPPDVADANAPLEWFHEPVRLGTLPPRVYDRLRGRIDPFVIPPTLGGDNRYALLFTSQISNRRHVEDVEFAYRVLRELQFPADQIYVLCYDGTVGAVDATAADMATWVGDGTPYRMQITGAATQENLESTLTEISGRMGSDGLLFVHTNNHGTTSGLCVDNSGVVTPDEWGTMLDGMSAFGTLVVTMEQCYSGAFLQPTLDHSRAARTSFASAVPADKVSWGDTHFDPWALAWFEAVNLWTAYGAALAHEPDTTGDGLISMREAFQYSKAYNTATGDDPQYGDSPAGCGGLIHLSRRPAFLDTLHDLIERYRLIEQAFPKIPIPDPEPGWGQELVLPLQQAVRLQQRIDLLVNGRVAAPRDGAQPVVPETDLVDAQR